MKYCTPILALTCLLHAGCDLGGSYQSGGFNPLDPGGGTSSTVPLADSRHSQGSFVQAVTDNTLFFRNKPAGDAEADRILSAGSQMKVIADDGDFVKVELDSGEVGFVSSIQIMDQGAVQAPDPGSEYQIYPPVDNVVPLDGMEPVDPELPVIPSSIDPDEPEMPSALSDDEPTPGLGSTPPSEEPEPADSAEEESAE